MKQKPDKNNINKQKHGNKKRGKNKKNVKLTEIKRENEKRKCEKRRTKIGKKGNTQKQTKIPIFGGGKQFFYSTNNKTNKKKPNKKHTKTNPLKYSGFKGQVKCPFGNQKTERINERNVFNLIF